MAFQYNVSFRVTHPSLDPAEICAGIGLDAWRSWMAGQPRSTPKGTPLPGYYSESYCVFRMGGGEDGELADCLREAVKQLDLVAAFLAKLRDSGGKLSFYVGWTVGSRGEVFDAPLLTDIARLGIELGIDTYRVRQSGTARKCQMPVVSKT